MHELTQAGFDSQWQRVDTEAGYVAALTDSIDVVFGDQDLPGYGTAHALAELQARGWNTPFIIVADATGEDAAVATMRLGAADYLIKNRMARLGDAVSRALDTRRLRLNVRAMQAELRASEDRFLVVGEASLEAVAIHEHGVLVDANPAFGRLFGYSQAEWVGLSILELITPAYHEAVLRAVRSGDHSSYEAEGLRKDGTTFRADISSREITHQGRQLRVAVIRDGTARYDAERALRESEVRFRELAENIQDVFYTIDMTSSRVLYVSPAFERVWGQPCDQLYADPAKFLLTVVQADRPIVAAAAARRRAGEVTDIEYRIVRSDGELRWIRDRAFPVSTTTGAIERVVGAARDITDFRVVGDQVREQASLLDRARDAIVVVGLDRRITYWNKGAERLFGWTATQVVGRVMDEVVYRDPETFRQAVDHAQRHGEWFGELQQVDSNGKDVITESRWTLLRDKTDQPYSILAISTDVTEKKALERQFLRAQRLDSIGTLASGIAHDLNNVLTPVLMALELLLERVTDETSQRLVRTASTSARRGADMVAQVLAFGRGTAGRRVTVQIRDLVGEVEKIAHETFPQNIQIVTSVSPDAWEVIADPTQLHQVLLNLCLNARDAMPGGGLLTIAADNVDIDAHNAATEIGATAGPNVVLHVTDSGSGMSAELIDKIFDPFFTTKEVGKGTGLGLSTARTIVESHGGLIRVYSEPGVGTDFRIYLPANTSGVSPQAADTLKELPIGRGETVLVVDDEAAIRATVRLTLEAHGYAVVLAANGAEAVAIYAAQFTTIDVVLLDMMMPIADGMSAIPSLISLNPSARIIATSGLVTQEKLASAGLVAKRFLPKPYTAATLLTTLREVLTDQP